MRKLTENEYFLTKTEEVILLLGEVINNISSFLNGQLTSEKE